MKHRVSEVDLLDVCQILGLSMFRSSRQLRSLGAAGCPVEGGARG